jgi:hypothetical protein
MTPNSDPKQQQQTKKRTNNDINVLSPAVEPIKKKSSPKKKRGNWSKLQIDFHKGIRKIYFKSWTNVRHLYFIFMFNITHKFTTDVPKVKWM